MPENDEVEGKLLLECGKIVRLNIFQGHCFKRSKCLKKLEQLNCR